MSSLSIKNNRNINCLKKFEKEFIYFYYTINKNILLDDMWKINPRYYIHPHKSHVPEEIQHILDYYNITLYDILRTKNISIIKRLGYYTVQLNYKYSSSFTPEQKQKKQHAYYIQLRLIAASTTLPAECKKVLHTLIVLRKYNIRKIIKKHKNYFTINLQFKNTKTEENINES